MRIGRWKWLLWALAAGYAVYAISFAIQEEARESGDSDASAEAACEHFHNVATDYSDGILTDTELREKLREVMDTAEGSSVEHSARAMFAAVTSDGSGSSEFNSAVSNMSDVCDPYR